MRRLRPLSITLAVAGALAWVPGTSTGATQVVNLNNLVATQTLFNQIENGDTLFIDALVPDTVGALSHELTFSVGPGNTRFTGAAAWEVAPLPGPRLVGVNIDIFDSLNNLVATDTFNGVLGGFAVSSLAARVGPGWHTYRMVITGNSLSTASLDISITAVPEPETYVQLAVGLGLVGWMLRRRHKH